MTGLYFIKPQVFFRYVGQGEPQKAIHHFSPWGPMIHQPLSKISVDQIIFIMLTNSVGQKFRQGTIGTAYLRSMTSEVSVEQSKPGGRNHPKARVLTYQAVDAGCWLEGSVPLHTGLFMRSICIGYLGFPHSSVQIPRASIPKREMQAGTMSPFLNQPWKSHSITL